MTTSTANGAELRQIVEALERLAQEKANIAEDEKQKMAEAKGRGYDTKVIRKLIANRKRDANDLAEEAAVMEMYEAAMGSAQHGGFSKQGHPDRQLGR